MKRLIYLLVATFFLSFVFIMHTSGRAFAEPVPLECYYAQQISSPDRPSQNGASGQTECDLAIDKQVSVNGGEFVEAQSADQALNVTVGDTVTWKITVSNNSAQNYYPGGQVTVAEALPNGVTLNSASPSTGEYSDGKWTITLANFYDLYHGDYSEPLPATLTLTTTVTTSGLLENTVIFSDYNLNDCGGYDDGDDWGPGLPGLCEDPSYSDAISANNSHSAFINVAAKKVVTTTSSVPSAPKTGFGIALTNPWTAAGIGVGSFTALGGIAYGIRKKAIRIPQIKA